VAAKVNQMSENYVFGLDVRVGGLGRLKLLFDSSNWSTQPKSIQPNNLSKMVITGIGASRGGAARVVVSVNQLSAMAGRSYQLLSAGRLITADNTDMLSPPR